MEINELPINAAPNSALNIELSDGQRATLASLPIQSAVTNALALKAPLASPAFTETPTAPTAATATSTTQLATTAFVQQELAAGGSTSRSLVVSVRNQSGGTMAAGTIVYLNGATGNLPTIAKALATSDATSAQTIGLVQTSIANNGTGLVVVRGILGNLNTSGLTEGQQLYLSPTTAGTYTTTKQYAPNHLVYIGVVTRAHPTQGSIEVAVQNGFEMDELHNVSAQSPTNGDTLRYNSSTSLWEKSALGTLATQSGTFSGTSSGTNTGDQTALTVPNTPAGNIASTTVQAAINELDSEKASVVSLSAETARATAAEAALTRTRKIVIQGDSLSAEVDVLPGAAGNWPYYLKTSFTEQGWGGWQYTNIAVSGKTPTTMLTEFTSLIYPHRPINAGDESWLILWGGTNDSDAVNGWSKISELVDTAIASGFKVMLFSLLPGAFYRDTFNNLFALNTGTRADGIVQPGLLFPNPSDTSYYYPDLVHLKPAANQQIARRVWEEMNGIHRQPINTGGVTYDARDSFVCDGQYGLNFKPGVSIPAAGTADFSLFAFYRPSATPTVNGMALFGGAPGCVEATVGPFGDVALQKRNASVTGSSRLPRKLDCWHFIGITRISGVTTFVSDDDTSIGFADTTNYNQPVTLFGASIALNQFTFIGSLGKMGYIKRGISVASLKKIRDSYGCFNEADTDLEYLSERLDVSPANQISDLSLNRRHVIMPFNIKREYLPDSGVLFFSGTASGYVGDNQRMFPSGYFITSIIAGANGTLSIGESPGTPANVVALGAVNATRAELTVLLREPSSGKLYVALGSATTYTLAVHFRRVV